MPTIEESFAFCEDLARSHYENFPVGSFLVPKERRKYVWAIYAFARTADDFADEGRRPGESPAELQKRLDLLDDWEFNLIKASRGEADRPAFIALAETLARLEIPVQLLKDLLEAYRMDVRKNRYKDFEEVFHYCRHSANPVGRLVLRTFGYKDEKLHGLSDRICTALQLANFWQDVAVDLAKDRVYLPQDEMRKFRVTEGDLHAKICNRAFQMLLQTCCERTKVLFNAGLPLCSLVGSDLRVEMKLTWLGGTGILKKIAAGGYDVFRRRPVHGTFAKALLLGRALLPLDLSPAR
ncbi:MAG: squalene synthase HpnC [Elusimicrobia bacterium RIFCSPHIGHO2_01_FULL_64_10]|nr:MAG: squalene synthase HpnC [Elusimicrobia bacterium RIFCSPHIGHO2_01_FULL_64_10]